MRTNENIKKRPRTAATAQGQTNIIQLYHTPKSCDSKAPGEKYPNIYALYKHLSCRGPVPYDGTLMQVARRVCRSKNPEGLLVGLLALISEKGGAK